MRGRRAIWLSSWCGLLLAWPAWSQPTERSSPAAAAPELALVVRGECPARQQLVTELAPLLHRWRVQGGAGSAAPSASAVVTDVGTHLSVEIRDTVRKVDDAPRNCSERARVAAVLIAMALEPPLVAAEDGPTDASPKPPADASGSEPATASEAVVAAPRSPTSARAAEVSETPAQPKTAENDVDVAVELSAMASFGLGEDPAGPTVGPLLGLRAQRGAWAVRFDAGLVAAAELEVDEGSARMTRLPMDVGVGYVMQHSGWSLEPSLGLALDPFFVEGEGLSNAGREVRLDVGPRATLQATVGSSTVRGLGALRAAWFPRTYELVVNPAGAVGTTPPFWLELSLGARFGLN